MDKCSRNFFVILHKNVERKLCEINICMIRNKLKNNPLLLFR